MIRDFIEHPGLPPSTLRRLVQRDVAKGERVLPDPAFTWEEMADELFIMFKPSYVDLDATMARVEAMAEAVGVSLPRMLSESAHAAPPLLHAGGTRTATLGTAVT